MSESRQQRRARGAERKRGTCIRLSGSGGLLAAGVPEVFEPTSQIQDDWVGHYAMIRDTCR